MTVSTPVYPKILIQKHYNYIKLSTVVRINNDGKFYLCKVSESYHMDESEQKVDQRFSDFQEISSLFERLHTNCYLAMHLTNVNINCVDCYDNHLFVLDKDQRTEKERLTEILNNI